MTGIKEIIEQTINKNILAAIAENSSFVGSRVHGVAVPIKRTATMLDESTVQVTLPAVFSDIYDDAKIISIDDSVPFMVYHKINNIEISAVRNSDYGRNGDLRKTIVDSYRGYIVACVDSRKTKISADEMLVLICNIINRSTKYKEYSNIEVVTVSSVLNGSDVYAAEYVNYPNVLPTTINMFRINYQLNTTRDLSSCIVTC